MKEIATIGIDLAKNVFQVTARIEATQAGGPLARRLVAAPGIVAMTASALAATTPDVNVFRTGRDHAAWLGLTPKAHSCGGKARLGGISKAGNRHLRRLPYLGAVSQITARRGKEPGVDWLGRMLERKPVKLFAVALADRMAPIACALQELWRSKPLLPKTPIPGESARAAAGMTYSESCGYDAD